MFLKIAFGRMSFRAMGWFGLLALMIVAPAVSRGATIFSNFGAGQSSNIDGNQIGPDGFGDNLAQADTFTPSANYTFTSLEIALSCYGTCASPFTVDIATDSGGFPNLSTGVVFTAAVPGTSLAAPSTSSLITLTGSFALTSGTAYWVVVMPDAAGTDQIEWNWNTTGDPSTEETAAAGGGPTDTYFALGNTPGAYEVDGTLPGGTPEPATWAMMLGGGLLLGFLRKFRA
jgi:hypothetical protein